MCIAIHLSRWTVLNAFGSAFVECAFSVNAINAHPHASVNTPIDALKLRDTSIYFRGDSQIALRWLASTMALLLKRYYHTS